MQEFSGNTRKYLQKYHGILEEMIQGMQCARLGDSVSCNFIVQMIPHHRAAIKMSENLLRYTTDIPLQEIAEGIVREQTKSIQGMQRIQCECARLRNDREALCSFQKRMQQIKQRMFERMQDAKADNDINISFMREMIPHHEGAVEMSKWTLKQRICPSLVPILDAIVASQEKGIAQMEELLGEMEGRRECPRY